MMPILLDLLIAGSILVIAARALFSRDPFSGSVLYIAFGLLMSLGWARLGAPDIALAEAAIGAGLTGALLIDATRGGGTQMSGRARAPAFILVCAGIAAAALLTAALLQPAAAGGLSAAAGASLHEAGVRHAVTAVLLNFRAYDTWMEVAVLLLAVIAAFSVQRGGRASEPSIRSDELVSGMLALLVPVMVLVGGLLLWLGTRAPGGAFQGGAVLGSAAVLLLIVSRWAAPTAPRLLLRALLGIGFAVFLTAGAASLVMGGTFLEMRGETAATAILLVEVSLTISIAAALALLFAAARSAPG